MVSPMTRSAEARCSQMHLSSEGRLFALLRVLLLLEGLRLVETAPQEEGRRAPPGMAYDRHMPI
jgi:hypothetical protein